MRLRNKKTGGVGVLEATTYHGGRPDNIVEVYETGFGAVRVLAQYNTLSELLEEWEDYKPKGSLIKDERIRKIVRALFDVWEVEDVKIDSNKYFLVTTIEAIGKGWKLEIPNIDINGVFKLTELCGEEEAPEPIEPTFIDLDERIKGKEEK